TNDRNALEAKQRGAAVFGIIQTSTKSTKGSFREDVANFGSYRFFQFLAEHRCERLDQSLAQLQCNISGEAVAYDDVDFTFENVSTFAVPNKIDRRLFQRFERFFREFVSFRVLFPDGEQAH